MIELEITDILERTIPSLARMFGSNKERAWEILNNNNSLDGPLIYLENTQFRHKVNEWWKRYHFILSASLGVCSRVSSPSKLPRPTYEQIMCLTWLTEQLKAERFIQEQREVYEKKAEPTLWQKFKKWIKNLF